MRRDGSGSALREVGSCAWRSRSRSRRRINGGKRKDRQKSKIEAVGSVASNSEMRSASCLSIIGRGSFRKGASHAEGLS